MPLHEIPGVGSFQHFGDYWECSESLLGGVSITVAMPSLNSDSESRLRWIAERWPTLLAECRNYIAQHRSEYGLVAVSFTTPSVIVEDESWTVYFNADHEVDTVVGVEFVADIPRGLTIGD